MFNTSIDLSEKYDFLAEKFKLGYEFLRRKDLKDLPVGNIKLSDQVTALVQEYETKTPEAAKFETHDRMFDIQYVISGRELFGVAPRHALTVSVPYNSEKDVTLYKDPVTFTQVLLNPGDFIVVPPDDGHKPQVTAEPGKPCRVKKIVIKVRV
ncbi:MAG: YhcH/YjgK/YiaL family protein [Spirochaetaceae bacterium]|jgi:YhcH/YjgK/YiaL family protein|nr:YhcH/YjgK/YiaL family protein [Spirochaetaceae bacterium]